MIQKHKFVEQNIKMLRTLTKEGYVSHTLLNKYNIFKLYSDVKSPSKMTRYKTVANEMKMSVTSVRNAVCEMKSYIKN